MIVKYEQAFFSFILFIPFFVFVFVATTVVALQQSSHLDPLDASVSSPPPMCNLCSLTAWSY